MRRASIEFSVFGHVYVETDLTDRQLVEALIASGPMEHWLRERSLDGFIEVDGERHAFRLLTEEESVALQRAELARAKAELG